MALTITLLIVHGLAAVVLLGGLTHQAATSISQGHTGRSFFQRYRAVDGTLMVNAIVVAYLATFILGMLIYPTYRLDVRIALVEMRLPWAIGLFEIKEHWAAIGLATLPLYRHLWRVGEATAGRTLLTLALASVVWFNFVVGHVINNLRGL
ncbi:MAG: hypothetical protein ABR612_05775 [Chromatocurvus sp.]